MQTEKIFDLIVIEYELSFTIFFCEVSPNKYFLKAAGNIIFRGSQIFRYINRINLTGYIVRLKGGWELIYLRYGLRCSVNAPRISKIFAGKKKVSLPSHSSKEAFRVHVKVPSREMLVLITF